MNTNTYQALINWLHSRHYELRSKGNQLILVYSGKRVAIITPPDRYQVSAIDMTFDEWVEFNKCIRNIRHYLQSRK